MAKVTRVKGNRLRLAIPLQTVTVTEHGTVTADYNVPAGAEVTVTLTGTWKTYKYVPEVNGNLLTITDEGTLPAGTYAVETTVVQADGEHLRSKYCNMVEISDCNDGVTQEYDDFISGSVTLEEQIFYFAKGDKGDAFTYEDFTEEQIADLQRPATEAAAALNETEQQRVANERARQTAESARESHEGSRILAEEAREGNEQTRESNETTRQTNEAARQQAETARQTNETQREAAETARQTAFETSQAARQTAYTTAEANRNAAYETAEGQRDSQYETAEASRQLGFTDAQQARQTAYVTAELQRNTAFSEKQIERQTAFVTAETQRATTFTTNEQQRGTTFSTNEQARESTFETNEGTRQNSVAGDNSRWGDFKSSEAQRQTDFNTAQGQRQTAFNEAQSQRATDFNTAQTQRTTDFNSAQTQRQTAYETAEGTSQSQAGDGSRWGAYKTAEATRDSNAQTAEAARQSAYQTAEQQRETASGAATTAANNAATLANQKAGEANTAAQNANQKATEAGNVNAELSGNVVTITNNQGVSRSVTLQTNNEEAIQIHVSTGVAGVSVSGLTLNAYYNDSETVSATATTDSNGDTLLRIPIGYTYKIVFPVISGCQQIADIDGTASLVWRNVEVRYVTGLEHVEVYLRKQLTSSVEAVEGKAVSVNVGGTTTTYTTDAHGKAEFDVPIGSSYTVTAPKLLDWYVSRGEYARTFTAAYESRGIEYAYKAYDSGLKVVDREGDEYTTEQFAAAIEAGAKVPNDAFLVKVATDVLVSGSGCFAVRIDDIVNRGGGVTWSGSNTLFNNIPANGNNSGDALYYNGLRASELIQAEGDTRNISTPAVDACLSQSITFGAVEHKGFLGAIGQWSVLWANRTAVDAIIALTRPNTTNSLSNYTTQKWTSTQYNANGAWNWASSANYNVKYYSFAVVPFFAY